MGVMKTAVKMDVNRQQTALVYQWTPTVEVDHKNYPPASEASRGLY